MSLPDCVERQTGASPEWTLLWLHGLGADGHDFEPIVPELVRPGWPALRFVFPHAPVRPVTINGGLPMRAWYDIRDLSIEQRADEAGVRESMARVEALLAREAERGVPASRVVLAGFSQGGAVALAAGLRREAGLAGIVALSTYLPLAASTAAESTPAGRATPVFMAHGLHDPVVPYALGERSRDVLRHLGLSVDWHRYPMPHSVCAEEVRDLGDWLQARFDRAG
ncbi:alpha/beta hydrolase [Arenimonas fontis]|uniref:Carboxylesterase n=1 Tax=Arenimonas fontis TaxID=2608255 RepID=A0A5B2Z9L2_9GAMM|nr:dienelactone hydrolase family protein [Arenimonas fontis]KAA2284615.1 carboxylesterase [Arenimonas fontis]